MDDKVEEIEAVWDSPKFKTNNQRLVHLMRHCKKSNMATQYENLLMLYSRRKCPPTQWMMVAGVNTTL